MTIEGKSTPIGVGVVLILGVVVVFYASNFSVNRVTTYFEMNDLSFETCLIIVSLLDLMRKFERQHQKWSINRLHNR
jgi:hypothetical protein